MLQKESFTKLSDLTTYLELTQDNLELVDFSPHFPCLVPRRLAEKIPKNCLTHPMARQFVPLKEEKWESPDFIEDPLCEQGGVRVTPSLLHKYDGRLLLIATGACAMHCRYCFRQHFSYQSEDKSFTQELDYIRQNPTLHEVILSGGDPLSLSDDHLENLLMHLDQIDHLQVIRFHSRFPIGIPERITDELLTILKRLKKQIVFVVHINCADEYDEEVTQALRKLTALSIPVLTQSVLLKGVNDSALALKALSLASISRGILPYYLHKLDKIRGAAHFEVGENEGIALIKELRKQVPGYAVPQFVAEYPKERSKTPLIVLQN